MKTFIGLTLALGLILTSAGSVRAANARIGVVAAENFYGDVASEIGGQDVTVASIMNNPDQDPHLFETTPGVVKQIADAQIVIFNGADYDPWMDKLLKASPKPGRTAIVVAELVGRKAGDNPHLWYR
jgi:zinc/manganese transport system substrate-binding protein